MAVYPTICCVLFVNKIDNAYTLPVNDWDHLQKTVNKEQRKTLNKKNLGEIITTISLL